MSCNFEQSSSEMLFPLSRTCRLKPAYERRAACSSRAFSIASAELLVNKLLARSIKRSGARLCRIPSIICKQPTSVILQPRNLMICKAVFDSNNLKSSVQTASPMTTKLKSNERVTMLLSNAVHKSAHCSAASQFEERSLIEIVCGSFPRTDDIMLSFTSRMSI